MSELIRKAIGVEKGSQKPGKESAGTINKQQMEEVAKLKMPDLNTKDLDQAVKIVAGTARSMGIKVQL
jgi:large subunit ribosomal protein L11